MVFLFLFWSIIISETRHKMWDPLFFLLYLLCSVVLKDSNVLTVCNNSDKTAYPEVFSKEEWLKQKLYIQRAI